MLCLFGGLRISTYGAHLTNGVGMATLSLYSGVGGGHFVWTLGFRVITVDDDSSDA